MSAFFRTTLAAVTGATLVFALPSLARADSVSVEMRGVVEYNQVAGDLADVPAGSDVVMQFRLDSTDFVDSDNFPTRGYRIDLASFDLNVGGVHVALDDPQPFGDAFFVLRDNDPAVDGFFIAQGGVELPSPLTVHVPGLAPAHELSFEAGYNVDNLLHSLNILDAVGTYDLTEIGSYQWTIGRFGSVGAEYAYQSLTISAVPEPSSWALLGVGALVIGARTRRSRPAASR